MPHRHDVEAAADLQVADAARCSRNSAAKATARSPRGWPAGKTIEDALLLRGSRDFDTLEG
jgi:hypothetical protein